MKYLLTFFVAALCLTSCLGDDDPTPSPDEDIKNSRTVIMYMSGENDLSSYITLDTAEMKIGSQDLKTNQHFIAFIDKAEKGIAPSIWEFKGGKSEMIKQFDKDFYNSDPRIMKEVLEWIVSKYPAKSYGLVLWGHASAWYNRSDSVNLSDDIIYYQSQRAYGRDTGDNTASATIGKTINIPTLATLLTSLSFKLDFIFCDCCNMGNVESAYELRKAAKYLIASPAEIPGYGAPYEKIVPCFFSGKADYYNEAADIYFKDTGNSLPLAVIQLDQMQQLADATATILQTINPTKDAELKLDNLVYYDGKSSSSVRLLYDMKDFMLANASPADYGIWETALNKAVIHHRCQNNMRWMTNGHVNFADFKVSEERCGCISMHIPLMKHENNSYSRGLNTYFRNIQWYRATGWDKFGW